MSKEPGPITKALMRFHEQAKLAPTTAEQETQKTTSNFQKNGIDDMNLNTKKIRPYAKHN